MLWNRLEPENTVICLLKLFKHGPKLSFSSIRKVLNSVTKTNLKPYPDMNFSKCPT